jgi:hypothetical protein
MTANVRTASPDEAEDGRGDVPHDETAALESVENGEAVAIPSIGGFLRGLGFALAQACAQKHTGSWWEAWAAWVLERSGEERPAPVGLGSAAHPPLEPAPGSYVLDRDPPRPAGKRASAAHIGG